MAIWPPLAHGTINIKLAVSLDALGRPGVVVCPTECLQGRDRSVVRPIHHVRCGKTLPIEHLETEGIVFVMAGVKIDRVAIDHRRGIGGEAGLHHRVVRKTHCPKKGCGSHRGTNGEFLDSRFFHGLIGYSTKIVSRKIWWRNRKIPARSLSPIISDFMGSAVVPTAAVGVPPTASSFTNFLTLSVIPQACR
jgi:hypothetical protein